MPNITVDGPTIKELDVKRRLVEEITDAAERAYGLRREAFVVVIKENSPENVGVGGELIIDRRGRKKGA